MALPYVCYPFSPGKSSESSGSAGSASGRGANPDPVAPEVEIEMSKNIGDINASGCL